MKTKFAAHTARGRDIVAKESAMLGQVGSSVDERLSSHVVIIAARVGDFKEERAGHYKKRIA